MRNNNNVWHKPNYEYCFNTVDDQFRVFTNENNGIRDIWVNGKAVECNSIALEIEGNSVFKHSSIYAAYDVNDSWDANELERIRNIQKKRS